MGEIGLGGFFEHGLVKVRVRLEFASRGSDKRLEPMILMINGYSHLEKFHAGECGCECMPRAS